MQYAIVISSQYGPDSGYPNRASWTPSAELLAARLAQHGYHVDRLLPGAGLVERLRACLRAENPRASVVVYFTGYVLVTETGEPALLLADATETAVRLRQMAARLSRSFGRVLLLVDGSAGSANADVVRAADGRALQVTSTEQALVELVLEECTEDNLELLVSVCPWGAPEKRISAFVRGLEQGIRELSCAERPTTAQALHEWLLPQHASLGLGLGYKPASPGFVLVPERQYPTAKALAPVASIPPAPVSAPLGQAAFQAPTPLSETADPLSAASEHSAIAAAATLPAENQTLFNWPPVVNSAESELPEPVSDSDPVAPEPESELESELESWPEPGSDDQADASQEPPSAPTDAWAPQSWRPPGAASPERPVQDEAGLLASAKLAAELGDDAKALAIAQHCLMLFPQAVGALQIAASQLAKLERWTDLARLYEQLIAGHPDREAVSKLCVAAARLYALKLAKPEQALLAIERACELTPKNIDVHLEAAALYENFGKPSSAENHYRTALGLEPTNERCYRRAASHFAWAGHLDAAWNAASITAALGADTDTERALLDRHTKGALPQPTRPLRGVDFGAGLSASAMDPTLSQLLTLITDAARALLLQKPKQQEQLLRSYQHEDAERSTTTLARSFVWTCRLFNIPAPRLYFSQSADLPRLLPVGSPAWLVGRSVGLGTSVQELVFIWGRALGRLRPEARLSLCYPETEAAEQLVWAALVAGGRVDPPSLDIKRLAKALARNLEPALLAVLAERATSFDPASVPRRVAAYWQQLDLVSNRLGLLAAGDPAVAARCVSQFASGATPVDEQLADLFGYAMSQPYLELRAALGIAVR